MTNQTTDWLGFSPTLSWSVLLDGKPWEAALPSSLSDERLEHLWASCQPATKCQPLAHILISHLVTKRGGLTREQFTAMPTEQYKEVREELVRLITAERDVRLAKKRFLAVLDGVCEALAEIAPSEVEKPSEADPDDAYRAAYAEDEASVQIKQLHETVERIENGYKTR